MLYRPINRIGVVTCGLNSYFAELHLACLHGSALYCTLVHSVGPMITNLLRFQTRIGAVVAEWLRRLTRNQLGSPRTGSNPVDCEGFCSGEHNKYQCGTD